MKLTISWNGHFFTNSWIGQAVLPIHEIVKIMIEFDCMGQWKFTYIFMFKDMGVYYKLHIKTYSCNLDCVKKNIFDSISENF